MADYDTGKDIVEDMLSRVGELQLDAAELAAEAKRYANRGYYAVLRSFPWLYNEAYPPMSLVTKPKTAITGIVATEDSITATIVETLAAGLIGAKFVSDRDGIPIRIANIVGTTLTFGAPYPEVDIAGGTGYVYQDEYLTPDVLMASQLVNVTSRHPIEIIGRSEMDAKYPRSVPFGTIETAAYLNEEYLRIAMVPEKKQLLELSYSRRPPRLTFTGGADDIPVVPHDERWLIADYGLYFLMVDHDEEGAAEVATIVAGRIGEAKDRQIAKMRPRIWIPNAFSFAVRS